MSVTALFAAAAMPLLAPDPNAMAEFVAPDSFGAVTTGGALFYTTTQSRHAAIRRLDLNTGETRIVFTAPDRRMEVGELQAGGGRVGFETEIGFRASRLYAMEAHSGAVTEVARGRSTGRRPCGRAFKLDDVAPSGELLFQDAASSCHPPYDGELRIRSYDPPSGTRTLATRPATDVFLSDGEPYRRLAGNQLLTFGERVARVRDLESGVVRRFRTRGLRYGFGNADVTSDGRVLLSMWRSFPAGLPEQTIRLVGPGGRGLAGTVVHRTRREFGEARFCKQHAVLYTQTIRGRFRLTLLDPHSDLRQGLLPSLEVATTCDDQFVATVMLDGRPDRVYAYELPIA
jgi:hypothetical protein